MRKRHRQPAFSVTPPETAPPKAPSINELFARRPTGMQRAVWNVVARTWPVIPTRRELLRCFPSLRTPSAVTKRLLNLGRRVRPQYRTGWDRAMRRSASRRLLPLQGALLKNV